MTMPVLRSGLQDHDRPVSSVSWLLPCLLRHAEAGTTSSTPRRAARAYGPHPADARQPPRGYRLLYAGDIAAAVGLKNTTTGDTLCDEKHPDRSGVHGVPRAVIRVAIEPKTKAGRRRWASRWPSWPRRTPPSDLHRRGDGPDHHRRHGRAASGDHRRPSAARVQGRGERRRTSGCLQGDHPQGGRQETKYARQSGGKGQYGHVKITIEPNEPGKGYEFVNAIVGGAIPKEYIPAVDDGIQGAMQAGVLAGYPVVDVKVTLFDGSYHEVDSSEMAFKIAGSMAFKDAMQKADPTSRAHHEGRRYRARRVYGRRHRRPECPPRSDPGHGHPHGAAIVTLSCRWLQMFGYATDLRSKTQGRGQYTMEPSHYVELPTEDHCWPTKIIHERTGVDPAKF